MKVEITPSLLKGEVTVPPSKSVTHRKIICAALATGISRIENLSMSKDISATIEAMKALGAEISVKGNSAVVKGIENPPKKAEIDCGESGSTLRFLIPVVCALGVNTRFIGRGKLPQRPITPYLSELSKNGITFDYNNTMPFEVCGKLTAGDYEIDGNISSQFVTGLLLALPLIDGKSQIILRSRLESKPYADLTLSSLKESGVEIKEIKNGYEVVGKQNFQPISCKIEGDYSQAAFFKVANTIGSSVEIHGLNEKSIQGDKQIVEICEKVRYNQMKAFECDCSDIPDLVPALAVLASFCNGTTELANAARLKIKESDRLETTADFINRLGGKVTVYPDKLVIEGVGELKGGEIDSHNDHRIAMAAAVASTRTAGKVIINEAECVSKSYPNFFDVFNSIGGHADVVND